MYCGGDKPIEALWAIKRTFSRLSRTRYEGPRYEIVFPRKLTLDFVSIFAQDDFIFFGFFVSFFFKYFITVDMVYTTATLVAPTALPPSLCLTLSLPRHTQLLLSHCCGCRIFVVIVSMFSACVCVLSVCVAALPLRFTVACIVDDSTCLHESCEEFQLDIT